MGDPDAARGSAANGYSAVPAPGGRGQVLLETDDPAVAEAELSRLYGPVRLGAAQPRLPIRVAHREIGPIDYSAVRIGGDLGYDAEPSGRWTVLVLRSGVLEPRFGAAGPRRINPGQVVAMEPPERPASGVIRHASWQQVRLRPATLAAADDRGGRGEPPRLGGHDPVSGQAAARLIAVLEHIGGSADFLAGSARLAEAAVHYLAAVVLETFPPAAARPPAADAHPETVRRAIAYMDRHAREDISLADIAAAAYVSIRGVQLAFRRHLNTTPVHHLRRIRLAGAHGDLVAADPDSGRTVGAIAAAWGFSNPGRFAIAYRHLYGCSPSTTLNRRIP
ncbi:helix-turn-helix transcriptional regulator [Nocardia sp. NPDC057353]|uniref:helix-turn-helix transcriptional regulator n=1 Tax=Nocardia sp. NPDC057353 TaxID=3346104 RepID=UPI0036255D18